jgi:hypothetical protein
MIFMTIIRWIFEWQGGMLNIKRLMEPCTREDGSTQEAKEIAMPVHGHTTIWGTHIGIGRVRDAKRWDQRIKQWWAAHKAARHAARLVTLKAPWDAKRETVRPLRADAAADMVAATHAFSTITAFCDLGV